MQGYIEIYLIIVKSPETTKNAFMAKGCALATGPAESAARCNSG